MSARITRLLEDLAAAPQEGTQHERLLAEVVAEALSTARAPSGSPAHSASDAAAGGRGWHVRLNRVDGLIESMDVRPVYFDGTGRAIGAPSDEVVRVPFPHGVRRKH